MYNEYNENRNEKRKYEKYMPENNYRNHIDNEDMYREFVKYLKWRNKKGQGEKWNADELISRSGIDFNEEFYTPYDFAYMANAMYADYNVSEKPELYMQMAKEYLRNDSFPMRGDERAYYDAQQRMRRYNNRYENTYNEYGYNNAYNNYNNRYENNYNRRGYNAYNERNSFRDRDNDGRYNE